jgi:hypothetical protein
MRGFWDELGGVLGSVGVTTASATAVARAYASPTLENIRAVEAAFREAGTSPPPELMNSLYQRYYDSIRSSPYYQAGTVQTGLTNLLPWIAGGILIFILLRKR